MKRSIFVIALVMTCVVVAQLQPVIPYDSLAQRTDPGQVYTNKSAWVVVDTTTSAGDEPTDLAVGERTYLTVVAAIAADTSGDGEISIYGDSLAERQEMSSWNSVRFRCSGITDNGSATYQVYAGTLTAGATDCELAKVGQLAFTIGQQASTTSTYEMADAVTSTASSWVVAWGDISPGSELIAEAAIDLMGANLLVLVPTTVTANCRLHARGY